LIVKQKIYPLIGIGEYHFNLIVHAGIGPAILFQFDKGIFGCKIPQFQSRCFRARNVFAHIILIVLGYFKDEMGCTTRSLWRELMMYLAARYARSLILSSSISNLQCH